MQESVRQAFWHNFLGSSPTWYKQAIIGFLILNPILLAVAGPSSRAGYSLQSSFLRLLWHYAATRYSLVGYWL